MLLTIECIPRDGNAENMIFKVFKIDHQIKWDFLKAPLFITVIRNPFWLNLNVLRAGHRAKAGCLAFDLNMKSMFRFGQNKTDLFYGGLFE